MFLHLPSFMFNDTNQHWDSGFSFFHALTSCKDLLSLSFLTCKSWSWPQQSLLFSWNILWFYELNTEAGTCFSCVSFPASSPAGLLSSIPIHAGRQSGHPDPGTSPHFCVSAEAASQPQRCQWGLPRGWDLVGYVSHLRSVLIECASFELQMGRLLFMGLPGAQTWGRLLRV